MLAEIQSRLLILGADLATPPDAKVDVPRIQACHASDLEEQIDRLEEELPELTQFILPGGSKAAAAVHVARTICRRAERMLVRLEELEGGQTETLVYLNRLSDYLFVASRWINMREGGREEIRLGVRITAPRRRNQPGHLYSPMCEQTCRTWLPAPQTPCPL